MNERGVVVSYDGSTVVQNGWMAECDHSQPMTQACLPNRSAEIDVKSTSHGQRNDI